MRIQMIKVISFAKNSYFSLMCRKVVGQPVFLTGNYKYTRVLTILLNIPLS